MADERNASDPGRIVLRWFGRGLGLLVTLAVLMAVVVAWVGPPLLERTLTGHLERSGVANPKLKVESITFRGIHLRDLEIEEGRLAIDALSLYYSFRGLVGRRVDRISVSGFSWLITVRDGTVDLGLPAFEEMDGRKSPSLPMLPFGSLEVSSSSILVDYEGLALTTPFSFRLDVTDAHLLTLAGGFYPLGIPVAISGEGDLQSGAAQVVARISNVKETGQKRNGVNKYQSLPFSGDFDLTARWRRLEGNRGLGDLQVSAATSSLIVDIPGIHGRLKHGSFLVGADLDNALKTMNGRLNLQGLHYREYALDWASLSFDDGGVLSALSARLDAPFQAEISLSGSHPSLPDFIENRESLEGHFLWTLEGDLPEPFIALYSRGMVSVDNQVPFLAEGNLTARLHQRSEWNLNAKITNSRLGPATLSLEEESVRVEGAVIRAAGRFFADKNTMEANLDEGTMLAAERVILDNTAFPVATDSIEFHPRRGRSLISFTQDAHGTRSISADAALVNPITVRLDDMLFHGRNLRIEGIALLEKEELRHWTTVVGLDGGYLNAPAQKARLEGISLEFPLAMGRDIDDRGRFSVGRVSYDGIERPGPTGRLYLQDKNFHVEGRWDILSPSPLVFSADLSIEDGTGRGKARILQDWASLPDREEMALIAPWIDDLRLAGEVRAEATLDMTGSTVKPLISASLRDTNLSSRKMALDIGGIAGTVVVNSLDPVTTPGNQVVTIDSLRSGVFEFEKGRLAFRMEDQDRLFLETMNWHLPEGGTATLRSSRFDMTEQSAHIDLHLENVDLIALLARATDGKIDGSGRFLGRVPLVYEGGRILLESGYIYAMPEKGRLGIRDEEWMKMLMLYINEAMAGHRYLSLVAERMEEALRDFEYNYLTVDLKRVGTETVAQVEIRGKGVKGDPPQEIGSLVLNINDLEEMLNRVVGFTMTREESIDRALEDLLDFR